MVDKNFAPPGFEAVESPGCEGCVFQPCDVSVCSALDKHFSCSDKIRPDGCSVVFVVRACSVFATANFPCDDMGTPV